MHTFSLVLKTCTFYPRMGCAVEKINIRSFMETKEGETRKWGSDHYREVSQNLE